jgi:hypothetical protein
MFFYMSYDPQSEVCQLKDWKKHRDDCSVLSPECLTRSTTTCDEEMQSEVDRITSLLKRRKAKLLKEKSTGLRPNFSLAARLPGAKAILGALYTKTINWELPNPHRSLMFSD